MAGTALNRGWKFIAFEPGGGDPLALSAAALDTSSWQPLDLPGDVNAALVRDGRMPDPDVGDNGRRCYWVTGREWWLRREFVCEERKCDERSVLCCDGIDGHVDLYLNGRALGRMENTFRPHRFDVKGVLADGPNVLLMRFQAIDDVLGGPRSDELAGWRERRALMRKPQFAFGWDWAPTLPGIGVMGGVWLEQGSGPRLLDASVRTHCSGRLDFKFRVNVAARDAGCHLRLKITGHGVEVEERVGRPGRCFSHKSVQIDHPALWWPRGMGAPALYDYTVALVVDGGVVETRSGRLGIREMAVEEDPFTPEAGPGISFWLTVNGRRVFCKGANWVPLHKWPAEVAAESYRFYVGKAAEAGFNMLRVWGGGLYERDVFYDLCDEAGIMVWQDFMFASAGYPVDRLREEIIAEATHQIRRLRNHACIALWCGCNEDVYSWVLPEDADRSSAGDLLAGSVGHAGETPAAGAMADTGAHSEPEEAAVNRLRDDPQIYTMILRGLVSKMAQGAPYVESSPQSYEDSGNAPESGNSHLSCWKYALFVCRDRTERFRKHFERVQSFDSEFCIQGPCNAQTLHEFLPEGHLWPPDDVWVYHLQRGHGDYPHYQQTLWIAGGIFGEIDGLATYVKHGQATHAEMMRAEFESARCDRPNNGGTMMWMYNDCWPTSNWSIIDYARRPKPAYYAAKRACATLLPIVFERGGAVGFFFSNDGSVPCEAAVRFGQARLDGSVVWQEQQAIRVGPVATLKFHSAARERLDLGAGDYLFIAAEAGGAPLPLVTYFADGWKDIPWPAPRTRVSLLGREREEGTWVTTIKVESDAYARFCHVLIPGEAGTWWVDDNFFDLAAGGRRTVTVRSSQPFEVEEVRAGNWRTEWP